MILIIGYDKDLHIETVTKFFDKKQIKYRVISFSDIPEKVSFDFIVQNNKVSASFYQKEIFSINLDNVTGLWVRRLAKPSPSASLEGLTRRYAIDEFNLLLRSIDKLFPKIKILSGINEILLAENKAWQKKIAIDLGFNVPLSFIGHNLEEAKALFAEDDLVYIKAFNYKSIPIDKTWTQRKLEKIYNKLSDDDKKYEVLNSMPSIMSVLKFKDLKEKVNFKSDYPYIIEKCVDKLFELRVTVVGENVFACKIDSQVANGEGRLDWREEVDSIPHSIFELPEDIKESCIKLLKSLNINYGAFDFIVTPNQEYFFLEVNPSGQWLWVDMKIQSKISEAIALYLIK